MSCIGRGTVMRKEVDYIEEYRQEMIELEASKEEANEMFASDTSADLEELKLRIKRQEIIESQYTRIRNEELWNIWVELIYPWLEREAKTQGLHIILDVDEEKLTGKITISGERFFINNLWCDAKNYCEVMIHYANDFWLSCENGLFVIEILFDLYDKEKTSDKTEEIENATKDFTAFRLKHGKKVKFKFTPEQE